MKKAALKEAIKGEITSILSENEMTTAEAFRALRDIHSNLPKWGGPEGKHYTELMGQALDVLQRGEITKMMDREVSFSDIRENMNLSEIQDQGLIDGINAITRDINMFGPPKLKSVAEIQTYVEAFGDGVGEEGRRISNNMKAAMRGGGDEESLSGLVGLKESLNPEVTTALNRFIKAMAKKYGYEEKDAVFAIQAALKQREFDVKYDMPGFGDTMDALDDISIREDEEPTSAELKKKDSITTISNKLQKLTAKMKKKAKEFKEAEGKAKDKIKDELKDMTAEKKELEKSI